MPKTETQPDYARVQEALDGGLIALVNQAVLWPRGLALRVHVDDNGEVYAMDFWDAGEYIAGWDDNAEDNELRVQRSAALRDAELDREAAFVSNA